MTPRPLCASDLGDFAVARPAIWVSVLAHAIENAFLFPSLKVLRFASHPLWRHHAGDHDRPVLGFELAGG